MRSIGALMRAALLTASSYRLAMVLSVAGFFASFVPTYFISGALQPMVQQSIRSEGGQYFGFVIVGISATLLLTIAVSAIPTALAGSISSGTLEALLVTRTPLYQILIGLVGYAFAWTGLRSILLVAGAAVLGVHVAWSAGPFVLIIMALMVVAYSAVGLIAGALVMVFRTSGPLITAVVGASSLLGGVYYSTSVIPSWLQSLSAVIPLTYALRSSRMVLLGGASPAQVAHDVVILALYAAGLLLLSIALFVAALKHARAAGTLSQY